MATVITAKLASMVLILALAVSSGTSAYFYQQQASQASRAGSLADQVSSLQSQITSLNKQIDSLNGQISQLETLNSQLGGSNSDLLAQITTLQAQVASLESQLSSVTQIVNLQRSKVIANQVTVDRGTFTTPGANVIALINIGSIQYNGYLRVSWPSGPRMSFGIQEFDINITTPIGASGLYSVPVSANATGNVWFQCYDYYFVNGVNICSASFTYSLTYWY